MELVTNENTTIVDKNNMKNATSPDGTIYTERIMSLRIEFTGGFFIKIEQKVEYPGILKTNSFSNLGRTQTQIIEN
jgi:hypothetical protein